MDDGIAGKQIVGWVLGGESIYLEDE